MATTAVPMTEQPCFLTCACHWDGGGPDIAESHTMITHKNEDGVVQVATRLEPLQGLQQLSFHSSNPIAL
ncbi:unnamed protein product [Allacma fusca]|uniref:Uncharacterized protein n=1 Tax=Allacma fusca TaxID=39272 RepID=A0A8J2JIK7_9HEXA|nr:unnamed protein product [Allacma fusca]